MKKNKLTRKELYDLVWSKTLTTVAEDLEISFHQLSKICKEMGVPRPPQGHWSRVRFGSAVNRIPLKPDFKGKSVINLVESREVSKSPLETRIEEIKSGPELNLSVGIRMRRPDPLVASTKRSLGARNPYEGILWSREGDLDVNVSRKSLSRALRLINTMIDVIRKRGHEFNVTGETSVTISGEKIQIRILEARKKVESKDKWRSFDLEPTGKLKFQFGPSYRRKEITEGRKSLEEKLPRIIASLELAGEAEHKERLERQAHWERIERQERLEQERIERRQAELKKLQDLFAEANRWHEAQILRDYLSRGGDGIDKAKSKWAREMIDWYDPTKRKTNDFLGNPAEVFEKGLKFP